jgi:hypothetical protein
MILENNDKVFFVLKAKLIAALKTKSQIKSFYLMIRLLAKDFQQRQDGTGVIRHFFKKSVEIFLRRPRTFAHQRSEKFNRFWTWTFAGVNLG